MNELLQRHLPAIREACRRHRVKALHAFGSVLRDDFGPSSDIDFLVFFDRSGNANAFAQFFDFKETLEATLGREIDLVSGHSIQNPFFRQELEETMVSLYAA